MRREFEGWLAKKAAAGDRQAFEQLLVAHRGALVAAARNFDTQDSRPWATSGGRDVAGLDRDHAGRVGSAQVLAHHILDAVRQSGALSEIGRGAGGRSDGIMRARTSRST